MKRSPMPPPKKPMKRTVGLRDGSQPGRTARLKPRSSKTAKKYVERRTLVAELFLYPTVCEVPWCSNTATDPHEPKTRTRGGSILNRANVRLICSPCHREIHDTEPAWAYERGFLKHSWDEEDAA
jgi:hypothetical protein